MLPKGLGNFGFSWAGYDPCAGSGIDLADGIENGICATRVQHAPMKFHLVRPDGSVESANWSGYAVTGSDFTMPPVRGLFPRSTAPRPRTPTPRSGWVSTDTPPTP